jgi:hypothetical protein
MRSGVFSSSGVEGQEEEALFVRMSIPQHEGRVNCCLSSWEDHAEEDGVGEIQRQSEAVCPLGVLNVDPVGSEPLLE